MIDEKSIFTQIHEFYMLLNDFKNEEIDSEAFVVGCLIENCQISKKVIDNFIFIKLFYLFKFKI